MMPNYNVFFNNVKNVKIWLENEKNVFFVKIKPVSVVEHVEI